MGGGPGGKYIRSFKSTLESTIAISESSSPRLQLRKVEVIQQLSMNKQVTVGAHDTLLASRLVHQSCPLSRPLLLREPETRPRPLG